MLGAGELERMELEKLGGAIGSWEWWICWLVGNWERRSWETGRARE